MPPAVNACTLCALHHVLSIRELDALLVVVGSIIGHSAAAGGHAGG